MPYFEINCEVCGKYSREWRDSKPHRFCSIGCQKIGMRGQGTKPNKYVIDPRHHDRIRRAYLNPTGNGEIKELASWLGVPRWKLSRFAVTMGWVNKTVKSKPWTNEEDQLLENLSRYCVDKISQKFKDQGYHRTPTAIAIRLKRKRLLANIKGYSAYKLSECLGIDEKGVTRLIKFGKIKADRRGTDRTEQQGGDAYYIQPWNIRQYVIDYIGEIDLRKVDKYWLVDILSNQTALV